MEKEVDIYSLILGETLTYILYHNLLNYITNSSPRRHTLPHKVKKHPTPFLHTSPSALRSSKSSYKTLLPNTKASSTKLLPSTFTIQQPTTTKTPNAPHPRNPTAKPKKHATTRSVGPSAHYARHHPRERERRSRQCLLAPSVSVSRSSSTVSATNYVSGPVGKCERTGQDRTLHSEARGIYLSVCLSAGSVLLALCYIRMKCNLNGELCSERFELVSSAFSLSQ